MPTKYGMVVKRAVTKRVKRENLIEQVRRCADGSLRGNRGRGWKYTVNQHITETECDEGLIYTIKLTYQTTSDRESLDDKWPDIVEKFAEMGCKGGFKSAPYRVVQPVGYEDIATQAVQSAEKQEVLKQKAEEEKELGEVSLDPMDHFLRIYNRQPQINRILDALDLGVRTDWQKRRHVLLSGDPGGGKTEIMRSVGKMIGSENKAYLKYYGPQMTKAGVVEELISSPIVPPILFIEEIEKGDPSALTWLLGIMDSSGEVRRTNYRVGNQCKNVRMLVIATANDVEVLENILSGSIYSRFENKIYCPSPDRDTMEMILIRECKEIDGDMKWVEPALQFGFDKWAMNDPRELISIMSCGADRLLDETFQQDFELTMHPKDRERYQRQKRDRQKELEVQKV